MQTVRIEPFVPQDTAAIFDFVAAIQEHERRTIAELKPGADIARSYVDLLLCNVANQAGLILMARAGAETIGFVCAWIDHDDDLLLREDARQHAYISDIFVVERWRRNGVARALLQAVEDSMRVRGCQRMRIRAKATNVVALTCYQAAGFNAYEVVFSKSIAATT